MRFSHKAPQFYRSKQKRMPLNYLHGLASARRTEQADRHVARILAFVAMGLQNAVITKLSRAVIRTTHLTGMVTDLGIAIGRILDRRCRLRGANVAQDVSRLRLFGSLILLFFLGGVIGAVGFRRLGFVFTLPLAAILIALAAGPVLKDITSS